MSCCLPLSSNLAQQLRAQSLPSGATWAASLAPVLGYLSPCLFPGSDMGLGIGSYLHLLLQPTCLLLSVSSPPPTLRSLCRHCGHPTFQSCLGGLIGVLVPRVYTWHFSGGTRKSMWGGPRGLRTLTLFKSRPLLVPWLYLEPKTISPELLMLTFWSLPTPSHSWVLSLTSGPSPWTERGESKHRG